MEFYGTKPNQPKRGSFGGKMKENNKGTDTVEGIIVFLVVVPVYVCVCDCLWVAMFVCVCICVKVVVYACV